MLDRSYSVDTRALPSCSVHHGSLVRPYRSHGPNGPGVYPQCVPRGHEQPHLLAWAEADSPPLTGRLTGPAALTKSEREVVSDAGDGFTVRESATRRHKSPETVKTQRKRILLKLGARNMAQAVGMAIGGDLIPSRKAA
jgi:DNA-binding NarL/FixJ family response regulator